MTGFGHPRVNDMQDDASSTHAAANSNNELQYELLAMEVQQEQPSHAYVCDVATIYYRFLCHRPWWCSIRALPKCKTSYAILLLILAVSASALVYIAHHTKHNEYGSAVDNQEMDPDIPRINLNTDDFADGIHVKYGSDYEPSKSSTYEKNPRSQSKKKYNDRSPSYSRNPYYYRQGSRYNGYKSTTTAATVIDFTGEIKIGILHSLTGTIAISEIILKDVMLMLIQQQNDKGGLLGKKLIPVVVDPASDQTLFAELAQQLIVEDKVAVVFGCWTSLSRKAVLPVFEKYNSILFYATQWEGQESSRNIFYTGAAPNQQAIPAINYLMQQGIERWILEGTDYIYPRTTNEIVKAYLQLKGVSMDDIREHYTPLSFSDWQDEVQQIKAFGLNGKKTAVISTINGDANVPFYEELARQSISSAQIPIMAFSVGENELTQIPVASRSALVGNLAAWNYFQSIDKPINKEFIRQWQRYTGNNTVTNDPIEATYIGFQMWLKAVTAAQTTNADDVINQMIGVAVPNLSGDYTAMLPSHFITKPTLIGSIKKSGQFKIEYMTPGLVVGDAWSDYLASSKDLISDWRQPLYCGKYDVKTGKCLDT